VDVGGSRIDEVVVAVVENDDEGQIFDGSERCSSCADHHPIDAVEDVDKSTVSGVAAQARG